MFRLVEKIRAVRGDSPKRNTLGLLEASATNELIGQRIQEGQPLMVSRFGSTEMALIKNYLEIQSYQQAGWAQKVSHFTQGKRYYWHPTLVANLMISSGFFPRDPNLLEYFASMHLEDVIPEIDILGCWNVDGESEMIRKFNPVQVQLKDLEPYFHDNPWTLKLAGKKVCVVHPFADQIESQYQKREVLFESELLPIFELTTLKAHQTLANNTAGFSSWFEALEDMKYKLSEINFEVAIIGAGAYGMPLAAYVKHLGKQAIHLGGATQILFGIMGKRWDDHPVISKLYNSNWVRPSSSNIPEGANQVEDSCYW